MASIRSFAAADRGACLEIFDSNKPMFFTTEERAEFERFLDDDVQARAYLVIERDGRIVACGGVAVDEDGRTAILCWGMVDDRLHRIGLGRLLTHVRLEAAAAIPGVTQVRLATSQHTEGFYHRLGFTTERVLKDGYGPGLDRCDMKLVLTRPLA